VREKEGEEEEEEKKTRGNKDGGFMSKIRTNKWVRRENFCLLTPHCTTTIAKGFFFLSFPFKAQTKHSINTIQKAKEETRKIKQELKMFVVLYINKTKNIAIVGCVQ